MHPPALTINSSKINPLCAHCRHTTQGAPRRRWQRRSPPVVASTPFSLSDCDYNKTQMFVGSMLPACIKVPQHVGRHVLSISLVAKGNIENVLILARKMNLLGMDGWTDVTCVKAPRTASASLAADAFAKIDKNMCSRGSPDSS